MDLTNLTKKNQEFIHIATNQLIEDGKSDEEIQAILEEVLPTIIENQKKGLTARTLLGAPTVWAASFTEKASDAKANQEKKNDNPWLMWLDTSLLFIGIVALLNALMGFFNSATTSSGLFSLLALGFGGVLLCTQLTTSSIASLVNLRANDQVGKKLSLYLV